MKSTVTPEISDVKSEKSISENIDFQNVDDCGRVVVDVGKSRGKAKHNQSVIPDLDMERFVQDLIVFIHVLV